MAASRWKRLGPKTRPQIRRLTPWAMDDAAWSGCPLEAERLEAERLLEASRPVLRDRNRQGFTFDTPQGASLERDADELTRQRLAGICPGDR